MRDKNKLKIFRIFRKTEFKDGKIFWRGLGAQFNEEILNKKGAISKLYAHNISATNNQNEGKITGKLVPNNTS